MACEYGHEGLKVRLCHSYQCGNRGGGGGGGDMSECPMSHNIELPSLLK